MAHTIYSFVFLVSALSVALANFTQIETQLGFVSSNSTNWDSLINAFSTSEPTLLGALVSFTIISVLESLNSPKTRRIFTRRRCLLISLFQPLPKWRRYEIFCLSSDYYIRGYSLFYYRQMVPWILPTVLRLLMLFWSAEMTLKKLYLWLLERESLSKVIVLIWEPWATC